MFITAAGLKTHYQRIGQGSPLVLLHGWSCDWQIWAPVIPQLSEHFQLVIPDLPAFGQSAAEPTWNSDDYAAWLKEFVAATVANQEFGLAGHSFGGKIAAVYAARYRPQDLKKLILIDASGLPTDLPIAKQWQKRFLGIIPRSLKDIIPAQLKRHLLVVTNSSTDYFFSNPAQRQVFQRIVNENIRPSLTQIKTPTLILWGESDSDTPVAQAHQFHQLIPHSQLEVLPTGHFPFVEQPATFVETLTTFVTHA